jgi:putative SOS response-associated peptidase YedK
MYTWEELVRLYRLTDLSMSNLQPRYNICPTTAIDVIVHGDDKHALVPMRLGLIPSWWSKPLKEMKLATFNARSDGIATKPMFRDAYKRRRCLIPASGYYEWQTIGKEKQPHYFTRADGDIVTIAGIHEAWIDEATGECIRSCSMVVTEPNLFVGDVHDRMPVVLEKGDFDAWMKGSVDQAKALMKPAAENILRRWPVSRRVNSSRADGDDHTLISEVTIGGVP